MRLEKNKKNCSSACAKKEGLCRRLTAGEQPAGGPRSLPEQVGTVACRCGNRQHAGGAPPRGWRMPRFCACIGQTSPYRLLGCLCAWHHDAAPGARTRRCGSADGGSVAVCAGGHCRCRQCIWRDFGRRVCKQLQSLSPDSAGSSVALHAANGASKGMDARGANLSQLRSPHDRGGRAEQAGGSASQRESLFRQRQRPAVLVPVAACAKRFLPRLPHARSH